MNQRKVSLFANCKQKVQQEITLEEVRARAGEAKHMQVIKQIEAAASRGDKDEADRLKRTLPAVVFGGLFRGGHAVKNLVAGSGLLVLDFDKLTPEQVETALRILREQPSVVMAAPSPTGRGIKVVVCTDHDPSRHPEVFAYTSQYFESLLNLTVDQSGKDISRLCFLFSNEKLHYNEHAQPLDLSQIGTCAAVALPVVKPSKTDPSEVATYESSPTTEGGRIKGIPTHVMRKLRMSTGNASSVGGSLGELADDFIALQWRRSEALSIHLESRACFKDGARNEFVFKFACKACQCGIPRPIAQAWAEERYGSETFKSGEVISAFGSAYSSNETLFGRDSDRLQQAAQALHNLPFGEGGVGGEGEAPPTGDELYEYTPLLPDTIFEKLPQFFQDAVKPQRSSRQRDIMLASALTVVSACMPGITGVYDGCEYSPHLYFFIVAKAANGKNMASQPFKMARHYVSILKTESERKIAQYTQDKANYDAYCLQMKAERKPVDTSREPIEPNPVMPWIPANISRAMFIKQVVYNGRLGSFVLETEADALSVNKSTDWGDLSLLLRAAFHHERISMARSGDGKKDGFEEIDEPHFAIFVTGTPDQFVRLMGDAQNGLYSRFCIYTYSEREGWHNPAPSSQGVNFKQYYSRLSETMAQYAFFSREHPAQFHLTESQWRRFNAEMEPLLDKAQDFGFENEPSVVKRLGLILYRVAMTLSAVRRAEREIGSSEFYCNDNDFESALAISRVCLEHSKLMLSGFKVQDKFSGGLKKGISSAEEILAKLPDTFSKKDLLEVYKALGKSETSCRRFVTTQTKSGVIVKQKHGVYRKVK